MSISAGNLNTYTHPALSQPFAAGAPRFGGGCVSPKQFKQAMQGLGFTLETGGGRHGSHFVRGNLSLPFSEGGHIANIGDNVLKTYAHQLGVSLKELKEYIRQPKKVKLDIRG